MLVVDARTSSAANFVSVCLCIMLHTNHRKFACCLRLNYMTLLFISRESRVPSIGFLFVCRQGSSDEVALLVAEFGLLDQQLASLAAAIEESHAILITEDELIPVASEIPDMRSRLGIA